MLVTSTYYPAMTQPNVALLTEAIRQIRHGSIVTADGVERPADAIVFGTGFDIGHLIRTVDVRGIGGKRLGGTRMAPRSTPTRAARRPASPTSS